ncbi:hypothetical protein 1 [Wenzhou tapeworm virus 1]|uniref:Uncharacterized protein n=1 Tax=Wenzhou tapeworm virus 1 TaxID=1923661 RepID=A0A1L3KN79_9MONO|nr:hypothetical protein 1 [Wenzhou tapeworm virus 1]APG78765.1 hypothetical protein 1 [Wenzhou tapeworm virus 1]
MTSKTPSGSRPTPQKERLPLINDHFEVDGMYVYYFESEPESHDLRVDVVDSAAPPTVRALGDIRGVTVSPNPFAAALFCSFPRSERWRFCRFARSLDEVRSRGPQEKAYLMTVLPEPKSPDPNSRDRINRPLPTGIPTMAEVVSVMQHWIAAVAVTKDMVNENITPATSRRVKAWLASINKTTEVVEILDTVVYQQYMTWVQTLPMVIKYIGQCCVGPHEEDGHLIDKRFLPPFQGMIDQVRMMNAYGRFKVAKMTFDMLSAADIRGVYKAEFLDLIIRFRTAWDRVAHRFGVALPYAAMLDPAALAPIQGAEWEKLYTLGKLHYCRNTGASMQNFRGYNHQDVIRQSDDLLRPIKRKAGADLISPEDMERAKLPRIEVAEDSNTLERLLKAFEHSNLPTSSSFIPTPSDNRMDFH